MINRTLDLIGYNTDLQRFADQFGDCIEIEDIQDLSKELKNISDSRAVKLVNGADSIDEAFDYLDQLAEELEAEAVRESPHLAPQTRQGFKCLAFAKYSKDRGYLEDWETLESDFINCLQNTDLKNWEALETRQDLETDRDKFKFILGRIGQEFLNRVWSDLEDVKVPIVHKFEIIEDFRIEYEPNISQEEAYGSEWFQFEGFLKCETYGDLLKRVSEWVNELILVSFDENGEYVYGETVATDFVYLLGYWFAIADLFRSEL